jgi:UDP-glucose:(heptosyl)LPS alpha-1,3-glucosyltransferase
LRLAFLSPFIDLAHGTERSAAELLERLSRQYGCEIHLFSHSVTGLPLHAASAPKNPAAGSITWHKVPAVPGPHLIQFLAWLLLNSWVRMRHKISSPCPFDLVISPGINSLRADLIIVHALFHRLRELSEQNATSFSAKTRFFRDLHRRLYYRLLAALERRVYSDPAITLAAVSTRTATLISTNFQRPSPPVIPNGVDSIQFSPSQRRARRAAARASRQVRDSDVLLLLIGNDWQNKGLPVILEAMAVCKDLPFRLLIVGDDDPQPFREQALLLGIDARCFWEHPRADVMELYAAADIYVGPSREDSFGLPVLEAMACGLPVITSKFAGVAELITHGVDGFILDDPTDVSALSQLLQSVLANETLRTRCAQAAVATAAKWTWDRNAAAIWELLKSRAAGKNSPT